MGEKGKTKHILCLRAIPRLSLKMGHNRYLKLLLILEEENIKGTIENMKQREKLSLEGSRALKKQSSFKITKIQGNQMEGLEKDLNQSKSNESGLLELQKAGQSK